MASFEILSSCICRDAFGFHPESEHSVMTFLQSSSPITWFELNDKPQKKLELDDFSNISILTNFQKKCIINDYNKTVLEQYLGKADFFIIDLISFASTGLGKIVYKNKKEHYFTFSKWFNIAYTHGLKDILEGKVESVNRFSIIDEDLIEKTVNHYGHWLSEKGYKAEEIILVKNKRVSSFSDGNLLYFFDENPVRERVNQILDQIYEVFERKLPGCHVIKMPIGVYSDMNHVWGLSELHFCKEYYDYLYRCFDAISKNSEKEIENLRDKYSEMFQIKRDFFVKNCFDSVQGKQLLHEGLHIKNDKSIVLKNSEYYKMANEKMKAGKLSKCFYAKNYNWQFYEIEVAGKHYYVRSDDCKSGYCGDAQIVGQYWKTVNSSTMVIVKRESVLIGHNGTASHAQMQIVQTMREVKAWADKVVTLSVWARVLSFNSEGGGGTIAIINANDYNRGKFYAKKDFSNKDWKRISLSVQLPPKDNLIGVTICLRALAGIGEKPKHALVEFCDPKLEFGAFSTNIGEYFMN